METQRVCVFKRRKWRNKSSEGKQQRKLLIILAPIRRNTASRYPRRRVMNASYCSPADIRCSSPPSPPPPSSLSHVPLVSCLLPSLSVLPLIHSGCDMRVTRSSSSYLPLSGFLLPFFSSSTTCPPSQPFHSNFPSLLWSPLSPAPAKSPIFPSPVLVSQPPHLPLFTLPLSPPDFKLFLQTSHSAPSHCLHSTFPPFLCCLSFCSPTQLTHPCWMVMLFARVCVCASGRSSGNSQPASAQEAPQLFIPCSVSAPDSRPQPSKAANEMM